MKSLRGSGRRGCNGICTEFSVYVDYPLFVFRPPVLDTERQESEMGKCSGDRYHWRHVGGSAGICVLGTGQEYVYTMGHFPSPGGNEIRVGVLEAVMAVFFCVIMLLCMLGGIREREEEIEDTKQNLYYIMVNLLLSSLLALLDLYSERFVYGLCICRNQYDFCMRADYVIRQNGRTLVAATRYMIMSLLGSGLLLLGICFCMI